MSQDPEFLKQVEQAIAGFKSWSKENGSTDFDAFLAASDLPQPVAEQARKHYQQLTLDGPSAQPAANKDSFPDTHAVKLPSNQNKDLPASIGRYHVTKILGKGGFGIVYLAYDDQLQRPVAVKVPHARLVSRSVDAEAYLTEARTVANLDHPHIVPVYDVGCTDDFPCFVVSKYIEGIDLSVRLKQQRLEFTEAAELVATVADALHYAHKRGLVHRDVKPGNILLGNDGQAYVVDFGMALKEQDLGKGPGFAGTPVYMSPEQARGEGHRVDGRSDIYSLGTVLYELLVGRRTFIAESQAELLQQISEQEVKPPRQIDDAVPRELERICLKSLAKRATDRYTTALDLAEDLRHFLAEHSPVATLASATSLPTKSTASDSTKVGSDSETPKFDSDRQPIRIVPKGLRSFDAHDADFFLELLPGPRDRDGLPDSIRFWKTRIEETDPSQTFSVGLIYGPSGCGKSSLVKAGLLPRLSSQVKTVYVEATPDETETRLLHGIRRSCPALPGNISLKETLAALRRGEGLVTGNKVLLVLDQFEQWLHSHQQQENSELVQALRQCDGQHVQVIVMVRDDFWMAATRFMRELEVRLVEAHNSAAVDLFSERHAEKVLAAFGRAFGTLPESLGETSIEQREFIRQSVTSLAEEGKVICVRLSLFAEMTKGKTWTPQTLKEVGGTEGVGVTFLEETFSASTAPPEHLYHEKAARAILKSLLPVSGTDIKGEMKSYDQLLNASGYASRQRDFDDLLKILDSEIRLITPTDLEGIEPGDNSFSPVERGQKYYQLTHDYLVPSLRDWLTRKQRETRRGRAELLLAERSATWNAKPENRHLPSWWEHASIQLRTTGKNWTQAQQAMMRRARRRHASQAAFLFLMVFLVSSGTYWTYGWFQGRSSVEVLLSADPQTVLPAAQNAAQFRRWNSRQLRQLVESEPVTAEQRRHQLHARLALVQFDPSQIEPLVDQLLETDQLPYVGVIRQSLQDRSDKIGGELWTRMSNPQQTVKQRFRCGLALAMFEPDSQQWTEDRIQFVIDQLVSANAVYQPQLWDLLAPIDSRLVQPLQRVFVASGRPENERLAAANAMVHFLPDDVTRLAELLTVATPAQFQIIYEGFDRLADAPSLEYLRQQAAEQPTDDLDSDGRIALGKRRAAAGFALLRQGDFESTLSVLEYVTDPEAMTQFIHGCQAAGITADELEQCFRYVDEQRGTLGENRQKTDTSAMYALLLALGEFEIGELAVPQPLVDRLVEIYARDPSSGVHGACGWLLRGWGQEDKVARIDRTPIEYDPTGHREWYVTEIEVPGVGLSGTGKQKIYFTWIVFQPGDYQVGSPEWDLARDGDEQLHTVTLTQPISVLDREVSWDRFDPFDEGTHRAAWSQQFAAKLSSLSKELTPADPVFGVSWFDTVAWCRWVTEASGMTEGDQCYSVDPLSDDSDPRPGWVKLPDVTLWPMDKEKPGYRLLTEAEWEVVCRAGSSGSYSFGEDKKWLGKYGWFLETSGDWSHPIGRLRPNPRGLFDMHGNVYEWCYDWYGDYDSGKLTNPQGPKKGSDRVNRGGSWYDTARSCRSSDRNRFEPTDRYFNLGFRVARGHPSQAKKAKE